MSNTIETLLTEIGYELRRSANYLQTAALYRQGSDPTSLTIYPEDNLCIDWVLGEKFTIETLIARTLKLEGADKVQEWLQTKNVVIQPVKPKPKIKMPKTYPVETLNELMPDHSYWLNRGIDLDTLRLFRGGLAGKKGALKHRYVFPIFNAKNEIVGFTGRDTLVYENNDRPKWKHMGDKMTFKWPLFLNNKIIKDKKQAILVESPGCVLSLWTCGIKNVVCLFGTVLNLEILNFLIKYDINEVVISVNNDAINKQGQRPGQEAAVKMKRKLLKYFDSRQIKVALPELKDFNEMLLTENGPRKIKDWYNKL